MNSTNLSPGQRVPVFGEPPFDGFAGPGDINHNLQYLANRLALRSADANHAAGSAITPGFTGLAALNRSSVRVPQGMVSVGRGFEYCLRGLSDREAASTAEGLRVPSKNNSESSIAQAQRPYVAGVLPDVEAGRRSASLSKSPYTRNTPSSVNQDITSGGGVPKRSDVCLIQQ